MWTTEQLWNLSKVYTSSHESRPGLLALGGGVRAVAADRGGVRDDEGAGGGDAAAARRGRHARLHARRHAGQSVRLNYPIAMLTRYYR